MRLVNLFHKDLSRRGRFAQLLIKRGPYAKQRGSYFIQMSVSGGQRAENLSGLYFAYAYHGVCRGVSTSRGCYAVRQFVVSAAAVDHASNEAGAGVSTPLFSVPIAPAVKGQTLRQRIHHRRIEERLLGDTLDHRGSGDDGVIQHVKNLFPEDFEGRLNVLAAEYAFIGVFTGVRDHFHHIFTLVDEAKRAAANGRIPAMNAFLRALIVLTRHRP